MNNKMNIKDRRKGPDFWSKWIKLFSIFNWMIVAVIIIIVDSARPEKETFFERILSIGVKSHWDLQSIKISFYIALLLFLCAGISLIANLKRLKRKDDRISKSNIAALVISGLMTLLFYVYFN